jgi:two-component system nitrogen regulation sensor histidine kinase NtrY
VVLGFNLVLILGVATVVGLRLYDLIDARASDAGARLHLRFVGLFSLAAVAPAVIVALFFGVLVNRGVDGWFSQRVQTVVGNSAKVANSYVEQQTKLHFRAHRPDGRQPEPRPRQTLAPVAGSVRPLPEPSETKNNGFAAAYVLDRDGRILARAEIGEVPPFLAPPPSSYRGHRQRRGHRPAFVSDDLFRALYRLNAFPDAYLYVVRPIEKGILTHLIETQDALVSYRDAERSRGRIQAIFGLSYLETALLVLVAAIWVGIAAANSIAGPGRGPGRGGGPRVRRRSRCSGRCRHGA